MVPNDPWWLKRPTLVATLVRILAYSLVGVGLILLTSYASPLASRSTLPLETAGAREIFLSTTADDPERVLLTRQRAATTVQRDSTALGGSRYWIHRYADPERPGIPERRLLSSRSRGARLLVPVAAVDLPTVLSAWKSDAGSGTPWIDVDLIYLYEDRLFQGLFVELRFPKRTKGDDGEWVRFDLVAVRDNRVRTVDWVLQPFPRFYREGISLGQRPVDPSGGVDLPAGRELFLAIYGASSRSIETLAAPVSLFDELGLAWGSDAITILDDRWDPDSVPGFEPAAPPAERWNRAMELLALHLAARIEDGHERENLRRRAETQWVR